MNKSPPIVPKQRHGAPLDGRILKTRRALVATMVTLVHDKGYHGFTVSELLERADVGRSTFYNHYRGKDDLLLRSFVDMIQTLDRNFEARERLFPVRELFAHVGESLVFHHALVRAHMLERLYGAGVDCTTGLIKERLAPLACNAAEATPVELRARALAGALFALVRWWVESGRPYPPEAIDRHFHRLAGISLPAGDTG